MPRPIATRHRIKVVDGCQIKAVEKDDVILSTIMETSSPSEAWRALVEIAAETNDAAAYRAKQTWRLY